MNKQIFTVRRLAIYQYMYFDIERTWSRLFLKRVVLSKFDI
jgi:hypothetical protein